MDFLVDTNIVSRFINRDDSLHRVVFNAIQELSIRKNRIVIVPQVLYELWAIATRPTAANGLGWSVERTRNEIDDLLTQFDLLADGSQVFSHWLELVTQYQVSGKPSHDARLVAAMQVHGLTNLLTLNTDDFKRFSNINVFHPSQF
jgi:predicted nucleic acid-binding protein